MKFFTGSTIKINKGDALEFTKTLEDKSVDLIIIDPPYKLEMPEKDIFDHKDSLSKKKGFNRVKEKWDECDL